MRRLETITNTTTGREARVYRDAEWQEWRVKHYQDGQHLMEADYHTDDKGDAQHHARSWAWGTVFATNAILKSPNHTTTGA